MPKNHIENIFVFRVNADGIYKCISHDLGCIKPCDILAALGFEYLPEGVEFIRISLGRGRAVCIYFEPHFVRFKFNHININQFLQLCTSPQNLWSATALPKG